ncbi:MAG: hypothetical protein SOY71_04770, partial [Dialister sp.]|nr:hypothetical protein [Dialister sp.]
KGTKTNCHSQRHEIVRLLKKDPRERGRKQPHTASASKPIAIWKKVPEKGDENDVSKLDKSNEVRELKKVPEKGDEDRIVFCSDEPLCK